MESQKPQVEALVIRNGRIVYAGDNAAAREHVEPKSEKIDLRGRVALPGFIESHSHPFHVGQWSGRWWLNCEEMHTIDEIVDNLRNKAAQTPPGQWVLAFRYHDEKLSEKRHPTRQDLDRVSRDHPVFLFHFSQHKAILNSKAFQIGGITSSTPDPTGGKIHRDEKGEPTGLIEEKVLLLIKDHLPTYSVDEVVQQLLEASKIYHAAGVTSVFEAYLGKLAGYSEPCALARIAETGEIPLRISAAIPYQMWKELQAGAAPGLDWGYNPERVHPAAVKFHEDGSLFTGAALSTPSRGQTQAAEEYLSYSRAEFERMVIDVHTHGWQVCTHANGDVAIQMVLDAYQRAQDIKRRKDNRHRIEHCQLPTDEQIDRMAKLGVVPSFFPAHIWHWGDAHIKNLGAERAARLSPMASAIRQGLVVGIHNDSPFTPIEPLVSLGVAITRRSMGGLVLGPDEAVTVDQGLRALTIGNAYLAFEEKLKGSLVEGKFGDVVILESNPYLIPSDEIKDIQIAMTIAGGEIVYQRG